MRIMTRRIRMVLVSIASALVLFLIAMILLFTTNPGARFMAHVVLPRTTQGVRVAQVEGRLVGPLTLHDFSLQNKRVRVTIGRLRVDAAETKLLRKRIRITELRIENVRVEPVFAQAAGETVAVSSKSPRRKPPSVALDLGELHDAVVFLPDSTKLALATARLGGTLDAYRLELEGNVSGARIPLSTFTLEGKGNLEQFTLDSCRVETLGGHVTALASVRWFPDVVWDTKASVRGVDPSRAHPKMARFPGAVSADIVASGSVPESGATTQFEINRVGGEIRALQLGGYLRGSSAGKAAQLDSLDLSWGTLTVNGHGSMGESVTGDFKLRSEDLSGLDPAYAGRAALQGHVEGPRTGMHVLAEGHAESLSGQGKKLAKLALRVDASTDPTVPFDARMQALGFAMGKNQIDSVEVHAVGTRDRHQATFSARGLQGSADLLLSGTWKDSTWTGTLDSLQMVHPKSGLWRLVQPCSLTANRNGGAIDSLRLESGRASLVLAGSGKNDGSWKGALRLDEFELARVPMKLPEHVSTTGFLRASATMNGQGKLAFGQTDLSVQACTLRVAGPNPARFVLSDLRLESTIDASALTATMHMGVDRNNAPVLRFQSTTRIAGFAGADSVMRLPMSGTLHAEMQDLSLFEGANPRMRNPRGRFETDLGIHGTVGVPKISGVAQLADAGFEMPEYGVKIATMNVTAKADSAGNFALNGDARAGEGTIKISGSSPMVPSAAKPLLLSLKTEKARLVETSQMLMDLDSDLQVVATRDTVKLTGDIGIPNANIVLLESPPAAIAPSPDVRFVGPEAKKTPPTTIPDVNVRVTLGQGVFFHGLNYATHLEGVLLVRQVGLEPGQGTGEIKLIDGYYRAYGQDLKIDRGRAFFSGLLTNPGLDVMAFRVAGDGTQAGVKVTGTADEMVVGLFTDPNREQRDAIAYIMTGQPLSANSGKEQTKVAEAAAVIGSNVLTNQMGSKIGLDEARVEGGNSLQEASLVVGKYLNPRLFVSYGLGLFDRASSFKARYLVTTKWALETEAGTATGADILFRTESGH